MDYLDPKKQSRQTVLLFTGYIFTGIAIAMATIILLYQAYGFGLSKNGTIIQNGLVFFSSTPSAANIYLNGRLNPSQTNTRLVLPEGIYNVKITLAGYRPWVRQINLLGGTVEHYDYPFLFPINLFTKSIAHYNSAPVLSSQSPNQQWLLVQHTSNNNNFDLYNLTYPIQPPVAISLPSGLASPATTSQSWKVITWADDNKHVLLQHIFDGKTEYILLDINNPANSINLSKTLASDSFTKLTLSNKKYDQYFLYNGATGTLKTASLSSPTSVNILKNVLAYKTYGSNEVLYVTNAGAPSGKVLVKELINNKQYTIRSFNSNTSYVLNFTDYNGTPYVAVGAASQNKVYIYQDPVNQIQNNPSRPPVPIQVLNVTAPNYLSFSPNAQFIVAENGTQFGVYDLENGHGYNYIASQPLDAPQVHATWMDGDRLQYISGGKLIVFDYDHTNLQTLIPASPNYVPVYGPNYKHLYVFAPPKISKKQPSTTPPPTGLNLTQTSLRVTP